MNQLEKFPHYPELKLLASALLDKGDELRLVGGCVRDFLINKPISDIDLACKYLPEKTVELLEKNHIKTFPTGIKHGTITAVINHKNFEITTLRIDNKTDGRHAEVEFTDDFLLDAKRRDFTINAISMDFNGVIHDYFNGQDDLENKIVRFIGDAESRIKEDYLRILRFFRFSCYYAKNFDQTGLNACIKLKENIKSLSAERIKAELVKILIHPNPLKTLEEINKSGILAFILDYDDIQLNSLKNLIALEEKLNLEPNYLLRFAALNLNQNCLDLAHKLRFSNQEKQALENNVKISLNTSKEELDELLFDYAPEKIINNLILNLIARELSVEEINQLQLIKNYIKTRNLPEFPINGNDLIAINIDPKKIGELLKKARKHWIQNSYLPKKAELIEWISQAN